MAALQRWLDGLRRSFAVTRLPAICLLLISALPLYGEISREDFGGRDRKAILQLLDEDLREGDLHVRLETAWKLARLGGTDSLAVLAGGLKSRFSVVRAEVVEAMGSMGQKETVTHLVEALGDRDHWVRSAAAAVLAGQGDASAIPEIEKLYEDEQFLVRRNAGISAHRLGGASGLQKLLEMLGDDDWRVRALLVGDLARLGTATALPAIRKLLGDVDWRVKVVASQAIGDLRDTESITPLKGMLSDRNPWVVRTAAHSLNRLGAQASVRQYITDVHQRVGRLDSDEAKATFLSGLPGCAALVRRSAEMGLGIAGDRSVLPVLISRMSAPQPYHPLGAARRIGDLGDGSGAGALHKGVTSKDEWVKLTSLANQARLGRRGVHAQVAEVLKSSRDWTVRHRAAAILGELRDPAASESLCQLLGDADPWVRLGAMRSAMALKPEEGCEDAYGVMESADVTEAEVPELFRRAAESGQYVRDYLRQRVSTATGREQAVAAIALARANDTRAWEILAKRLPDDDARERIAAGIALGMLGDTAAVPAMLQHMSPDDTWTFHSLRAALRAMGDSAVPVLMESLNHEEEPVRTMAHLAIEEITGTKVAFNPKEKRPKRREAWIQAFRLRWEDYTFIRDLGYESIARFQKVHALPVSGNLDHWTKNKVKELREQKQKPEEEDEP